jgi:triosephosphate isomerase
MVTSARRRVVAGNWKMNGSRAANAALLRALVAAPAPAGVALVVCPPMPYLADARSALEGSALGLGAQDCSAEAKGAFTGETAAAMLADVGCTHAIVGHSERRALHGETDAAVAAKALRALEAGLAPIVCVGETLAERDAGSTDAVVLRQLAAVLGAVRGHADAAARLVVAYEPVWAIGTGRRATVEQVAAVHAALGGALAAAGLGGVPVLYGGSVKPDNAEALFSAPGVDGGLIGGASLQAADFLAIAAAARPAAR